MLIIKNYQGYNLTASRFVNPQQYRTGARVQFKLCTSSRYMQPISYKYTMIGKNLKLLKCVIRSLNQNTVNVKNETFKLPFVLLPVGAYLYICVCVCICYIGIRFNKCDHKDRLIIID